MFAQSAHSCICVFIKIFIFTLFSFAISSKKSQMIFSGNMVWSLKTK